MIIHFSLWRAYSVDKEQRIRWFRDEQPDSQIQQQVLKNISILMWNFVFTHTVPFKYIPTERLLSEFEQKNVDQSTEVVFR